MTTAANGPLHHSTKKKKQISIKFVKFNLTEAPSHQPFAIFAYFCRPKTKCKHRNMERKKNWKLRIN